VILTLQEITYHIWYIRHSSGIWPSCDWLCKSTE